MNGVLVKNMELFFNDTVAISFITDEDVKGLKLEGSDYENAIDIYSLFSHRAVIK